MARRTVADLYIDGQLVPAGSDDSHELAERITNPLAWDGSEEPAGLSDGEQPSDEDGESDEGEGEPTSEVPPKGGAGSGKDAWAAYAAANGVTVEADASRDDIVAALAAAGVPTE